jgi:hypothetical protein
MSNVVGPVCHIPPATTPGDPRARALPAVPGPATPDDLGSIVALLNALRQIVMNLSDELKDNQGVTNNFYTQDDPKKARWVERKRVTQRVRVYQNNDKTSKNYVDVDQINGLVMQDRKTGALWNWNRDGRR